MVGATQNGERVIERANNLTYTNFMRAPRENVSAALPSPGMDQTSLAQIVQDHA
jgi:hypothetical protein